MSLLSFVIRILRRALSNCCDRYRKFGLHKLHLFYVLIIYSLLGGLIFHHLEFDNQIIRLEQKLSTNRSRLKFLHELKSVYGSKFDLVNESKNAYSLLELYEQENCPISVADKAQWDFWASVSYCITIYTTIGYGNNAPVTTAGRAMTIIYAMIGVPLLLALLSHVGQIWACWLRTADARLRPIIARWCENIRAKKSGKERGQSVNLDRCSKEKFDVIVPAIGFSMLFGWLLLCAAHFNYLNQQRTFFESFYFIFITFSTIGLGDVLPDNIREMFSVFPFILAGLSLVSLCINLIKYQIEKIDDKTEGMLQQIIELPADLEEETDIFENYDNQNQDPPSHKGKHTIFDQVALGVLQTVVINARYVEVSVQTDESYVRNL